MAQVKPIAKIHAAACYFAFVTRDIKAIASYFDVNERTIRRWAKDEEWQIALQACGYTGDRNFEVKPYRDASRDMGELFDRVREMYIEAIKAGVPKHRLATLVSEKVGLPRRRIHAWAMKYDWHESSL